MVMPGKFRNKYRIESNRLKRWDYSSPGCYFITLVTQNQPFRRLPKSISSFLSGFKSAVNSKIDDYIDKYGLDIPKYNRNNHFFQPDYYDHIIQDEQSYQKIAEYIKNNPLNWKNDRNNDI
jgi:putative transposase